ncbi:unnamed protein product [Moneuplotes crassus]|uniref:Mitochondrial carrier protein n=1 Tax=Euplotes crassus TaxID=5936 RepID=A0AAD2CY47_EUPCR|nr:unnamed protein product [Moneuplotes crassus]
MAEKNSNAISERTGWKTACSGFAGSISAFIFHPLENLKLRLQANDGMSNNHLPHYRGLVNTAKIMYQTEGMVSFFRGVFVNFLGNSSANFIFFYMYAVEKRRWNYDRETSPSWVPAIISLESGVVACLITNPIWTVKTRLGLHLNTQGKALSGFGLTRKIVTDMWSKEGPTSFYRGFPAACLLSIYGVIQMTCYENLNKLFGYKESEKSYKKISPFFIGGISKCLASTLLHPLTLVKTRQQKQRFSTKEAQRIIDKNLSEEVTKAAKNADVYYVTIHDSAKSIFRNEGMRGFYKGLSPNLIRIFPSSGVFFMIYEAMLKFLE